ncbi:hypothetical protein PRIPAC_71573 [Pristionchus pacificus]|uniref:Uncharacterized protein n=1 Tax=Pristionchus pacificus TaxID=54126 RepID=A0A2A6CQU8_PRIPA|nr:hypothetical protein PRIPAC_71573 [Pristionchus pacificus]|eukprot:PDM80592.1 hypothetical protein PRIPAC_35595 [Pristionchus pacificus]
MYRIPSSILYLFRVPSILSYHNKKYSFLSILSSSHTNGKGNMGTEVVVNTESTSSSAHMGAFEWSKEWNLPLNEMKCTVVHYGNLSPRAQYLINGTPLSVSPSIKDLGVLMQSSLKFNDHISRIVSKARAKVNLIFKCFFSTEPGLYSRAFSTFVRPLLEYGSVVWSPHTVTLANHIEGVQRNFSKRLFIRCRIPFSLYPDRIAQLSLPTLEHRRLISDILFLHKSIHGFYYYVHPNLFKLSPLVRSLRRSHSLRIVLPYALPKSHSNFLSIDGTCYLLNSYIALLPISDLIFCLFLLSHLPLILSCGSNTNLLLPRRPTPPNRIVNMTTDLHPKPNEDQLFKDKLEDKITSIN